MTETLRLAWSIAASGWRSSYNRTFRFSRMKSAVIFGVLQAAFVAFIATRARLGGTRLPAGGLVGVFALIAIQMGWFGLMYGFSRGQFQLYRGILVPLFQMSPARPMGFLLGRVIEAVPTRAWSCLLWAWAYSGVVPGPGRWPAALGLAAIGLIVGMVAHLSGLLLLTAWNRYSPKTARNGLFIFGGLTMAAATAAVIYLSKGGTVAELALIMRDYRLFATGILVGVAGIPGALLLGAVIVRPEAVEDFYRRGLYQVLELAEADYSRPGRSVWLPIGNNVLRAVLSREWIELSRARVARIQLMIWLAGTVGVYFAGQAMIGQPLTRVIQFVGALSLLTWFIAFGHWVVRTFEKERLTLILYRLATVPTRRLILAKFLSVFTPSAILVALSAIVGALAARVPVGQLVTVTFWTLVGLLAGTLGGLGVTAATANEQPDEQDAGAGPGGESDSPQTTGGPWWSIARTVALVVTAALPIWIAAGQPGLTHPLPSVALFTVSAIIPTGLLVGGVLLMVRSWEVSR